MGPLNASSRSSFLATRRLHGDGGGARAAQLRRGVGGEKRRFEERKVRDAEHPAHVHHVQGGVHDVHQLGSVAFDKGRPSLTP